MIFDVAGADLGKTPVATVHLPHDPAQGGHDPLDVHDHRREQVRDAVVLRQLHSLGVNHQHAQCIRRVLEQQRGKYRVYADGFARSGGAGDEQMGHDPQIGAHRLPGDILPQAQAQRPLEFGESPGFHHIAQRDHRRLDVGHLDAHQPLAGDRRLDADAARREGQRQVIGQRGDFADLDLGAFATAHGDELRLNAELDYHRPHVRFHDFGGCAQAGQRLLNGAGLLADKGDAVILLTAHFQDIAEHGKFPGRTTWRGRDDEVDTFLVLATSSVDFESFFAFRLGWALTQDQRLRRVLFDNGGLCGRLFLALGATEQQVQGVGRGKPRREGDHEQPAHEQRDHHAARSHGFQSQVQQHCADVAAAGSLGCQSVEGHFGPEDTGRDEVQRGQGDEATQHDAQQLFRLQVGEAVAETAQEQPQSQCAGEERHEDHAPAEALPQGRDPQRGERPLLRRNQAEESEHR